MDKLQINLLSSTLYDRKIYSSRYSCKIQKMLFIYKKPQFKLCVTKLFNLNNNFHLNNLHSDLKSFMKEGCSKYFNLVKTINVYELFYVKELIKINNLDKNILMNTLSQMFGMSEFSDNSISYIYDLINFIVYYIGFHTYITNYYKTKNSIPYCNNYDHTQFDYDFNYHDDCNNLFVNFKNYEYSLPKENIDIYLNNESKNIISAMNELLNKYNS